MALPVIKENAACVVEQQRDSSMQRNVDGMEPPRGEPHHGVVEPECGRRERAEGFVACVAAYWGAPEVIDKQVGERRQGWVDVCIIHNRESVVVHKVAVQGA